MTDPPRTPDQPPPRNDTPECDVCGSTDTVWVKCKLICRHCRAIIMSCGDL
ncbi:MAG: hypothetical protein IRY91_09965 [Gemmatimonadaceae bacterium]|nr:hypothetical protein [Gemmatimonadaceae bacterium]